VVAAGNRAEDRALVRALSSALVNRVAILNVRVDLREWLIWARANGIRSDIQSFVVFQPDALARPVPAEPVPFSTPRAWASLSRALDLVEQKGIMDVPLRRALAFGRVSAQDAAVYCALAEHDIATPQPLESYLNGTAKLPDDDSGRWFVLNWIREELLRRFEDDDDGYGPLTVGSVTPEQINKFLLGLPQEHRFALLVDMVGVWSRFGADESMLASLVELTGI
jgi:hypothetical protein